MWRTRQGAIARFVESTEDCREVGFALKLCDILDGEMPSLDCPVDFLFVDHLWLLACLDLWSY